MPVKTAVRYWWHTEQKDCCYQPYAGANVTVSVNLLYENILFVVTATAFLGGVGWAWRTAKPYDLPQPLPGWFRIWFLTVQLGGGLLPLAAMVWSLWQGYFDVASLLASYFLLLGLQILSESLLLRRFHTSVFVMVPYLYLPYRIWQLYEGWMWLNPVDELAWAKALWLFEIVLWLANYALDLSQLPRLMHWETKDDGLQ